MNANKVIRAAFYATGSGNEPVREWLRDMAPEDRKSLGEDIAAVEFTWPVGMPLVRPMKQGLWELRSSLSGNRIARILFCQVGSGWCCFTVSSRSPRKRRATTSHLPANA